MIGIVCVMHKCAKCKRNTFDYINKFLKTLHHSCLNEFKVYLFDNGSDEVYVPKFDNIEYERIENQEEFGLGKPLNDGVKKAIRDGCELIIISNDDLIVNRSVNNFINIIRRHKIKDTCVYGPLTNGVLKNSFQKAYSKGKGFREITNEKKPWGILNGFFFAFTPNFYEKFKKENGNLFEDIKWGGGELAFNNRVRPLGARFFIIKNCWLYHNKLRDWKK